MEKPLSQALGQEVTKLAAQEKQLLLSRLLARFAHEVRNPLSSLDIHVQLLEEELGEAAPELKERTAPRFEIIQGELHRLENIVKHFLSLARPSTLELNPMDLGQVINRVCDLFQPEAAARGIEIAREIPAPIPTLMADEAQLTQALVNLVINAMQAIERRGKVVVSAARDARQEVVAIEVRDTGPGIAADDQPALFEPFFTTKAEGSGLGLWIVQQIVMAHGGVVKVGDAPGGGAVFSIWLPLPEKEESIG